LIVTAANVRAARFNLASVSLLSQPKVPGTSLSDTASDDTAAGLNIVWVSLLFVSNGRWVAVALAGSSGTYD
jgi:hypothetical protein